MAINHNTKPIKLPNFVKECIHYTFKRAIKCLHYYKYPTMSPHSTLSGYLKLCVHKVWVLKSSILKNIQVVFFSRDCERNET